MAALHASANVVGHEVGALPRSLTGILTWKTGFAVILRRPGWSFTPRSLERAATAARFQLGRSDGHIMVLLLGLTYRTGLPVRRRRARLQRFSL